MALVTGFDRQNIHRGKRHPTETECDYAIFEDNGRKYVQISSSGSKNRKTRGGVTQTYQFDLEGARELMRIIQTAFPQLS
jgi:hypothetical protein